MSEPLNLKATVDLDYEGNPTHVWVHDDEQGCCESRFNVSIGREDVTVRRFNRRIGKGEDDE